MKEYIERETILKTPPFTKCVGDLSEYAEGYLDCVEDACEVVKKTPTADVEPVRHGEWLKRKEYVCYPFHCSVCDGIAERKTNYCSDCGAKMDGGKER